MSCRHQSSVCVCAYLAVRRSNLSKKRWSHRRKRAATLGGIEITLQVRCCCPLKYHRAYFALPCAAVCVHLCGQPWPLLSQLLPAILPSLQLINCIFFIIPNAYVLGHLCSWFEPLVMWSAFVRWTIWNTIFLIFVIQAHSANPANGPYWRTCGIA